MIAPRIALEPVSAPASAPFANTPMNSLPKIGIIPLGGTISSVAKPGIGASPSVDVGKFAKGLPGVSSLARIVSEQSRWLPSSQMTMNDLLYIWKTARRLVLQGCNGVVVTQGTDTLEEIAFGLDLLWDLEEPLVVTGAMHAASSLSPDGPANVTDAIRVAASEAARGLGALAVLNQEIHAARFVRKSHTSRCSAFRSVLTGVLGWVSENNVRIALRPTRRFHVGLACTVKTAPPVCLLKMSMGDDGRLLPFLSKAGFAGLVIEGFGGGHVPETFAAHALLEPLTREMPVLLVSRTGDGEVLYSTYGGFAGSEADLIRKGVIFAGALDGVKARVLLTLLLAGGASHREVQKACDEVGPLC